MNGRHELRWSFHIEGMRSSADNDSSDRPRSSRSLIDFQHTCPEMLSAIQVVQALQSRAVMHIVAVTEYCGGITWMHSARHCFPILQTPISQSRYSIQNGDFASACTCGQRCNAPSEFDRTGTSFIGPLKQRPYIFLPWQICAACSYVYLFLAYGTRSKAVE